MGVARSMIPVNTGLAGNNDPGTVQQMVTQWQDAETFCLQGALKMGLTLRRGVNLSMLSGESAGKRSELQCKS